VARHHRQGRNQVRMSGSAMGEPLKLITIRFNDIGVRSFYSEGGAKAGAFRMKGELCGYPFARIRRFQPRELAVQARAPGGTARAAGAIINRQRKSGSGWLLSKSQTTCPGPRSSRERIPGLAQRLHVERSKAMRKRQSFWESVSTGSPGSRRSKKEIPLPRPSSKKSLLKLPMRRRLGSIVSSRLRLQGLWKPTTWICRDPSR
jgi:hypothetical protein